MTRLESLINNIHKANLDRNIDAIEYKEIQSNLGALAYGFSLNGRLYVENSKGEVVKVRVRGWKYNQD
ncbi:MAG: hypothetical protein WCD89_10520 [Anaerocolumna sp.]